MDGNAPLAPGDPHLLSAVGTFEVPVLLVMGPGLEAGPLAPHRPDDLQEADVFLAPPLQVPGQGAVQAQHNQYDGNKLQHKPAGEQENHIQHQIQRQQEYIELISAIAPRHEARQPTADHRRSPPNWKKGF